MLSPAPQVEPTKDDSRVRRAVVFPLVCAFVGLFLSAMSAGSSTSSRPAIGAPAAITPTVAVVIDDIGTATTSSEPHRRPSSLAYDALAHDIAALSVSVADESAHEMLDVVRADSVVIHWYDATAPPRASI